MDISHGKLGKIKGTELTFKNLACVHTVVSLSPNIYGGGFNLVRDFQHFGMCDQQRLKHACTYTQTDQNLCISLEYLMSVKLVTEDNLEFLSLKGGCTGLS